MTARLGVISADRAHADAGTPDRRQSMLQIAPAAVSEMSRSRLSEPARYRLVQNSAEPSLDFEFFALNTTTSTFSRCRRYIGVNSVCCSPRRANRAGGRAEPRDRPRHPAPLARILAGKKTTLEPMAA